MTDQDDALSLPPSVTPFSLPRDFLDNRFVYAVISPRAGGLSLGVNMNPDKRCNFDCGYCEVDRSAPARESALDVEVMAEELRATLQSIFSGEICRRPRYRDLSRHLLELRHVALSGDGEPTLCPNFTQVVQAVVHLRALQDGQFFKIVLITNGTELDSPGVEAGLQYLTTHDEIWIKLDAGSQAYADRVNRGAVPLEKVLGNTLALGRKRPIVIQSLFPLVAGEKPPPEEIDHYIGRLNELKNSGARISLVQIYSATRPTPQSECGHLPLKALSAIRQRVKAETGLRTEVY